jgi:hypothetical protein
MNAEQGIQPKRIRKHIMAILISFLTLLVNCTSVATNEPYEEVWKEYLTESNLELDTTKVEGRIVRVALCDPDGSPKRISEFQPEIDIYERVTTYDNMGNIVRLETFDPMRQNGIVQENVCDASGKLSRKYTYSIENGVRVKQDSFEISNSYDNSGNIISTQMRNTQTEYLNVDYFNKNGLVERSVTMDDSEKIIAEVTNDYNGERLTRQVLNFPEVSTIKEIQVEYFDGLKKLETEKVNGDIVRISSYDYAAGDLTKITRDEVKTGKKRVVLITRRIVQ